MATIMGRDMDAMRSEFTTGLINAHAIEKQARQLIERQIERSRDYPEVASRLRLHLEETNMQEERLDKLLESFDTSRSVVKDAMMSLGANMSALLHAVSDDEILKNTFANAAFENYEAAAYESLIAMAETAGFDDAVPLLKESLAEERAMAEWIHENVGLVTRRYLELKASGRPADR